MNKLLIFAVFFFTLYSCKDDSQTSKRNLNTMMDTFKISDGNTFIDSCMTTALKEAIISYMDIYIGSDIYCVYFFEKDGADYFTIWNTIYAPNGLLEKRNPGIHFNYYWFQLNFINVVFISREDDERILPFKPCINWLDTLSIEPCSIDRLEILHVFSFRSYKYEILDGDCHVEALRDTIYMDFLGKDGTSYEMKYLKRENEKLKQE